MATTATKTPRKAAAKPAAARAAGARAAKPKAAATAPVEGAAEAVKAELRLKDLVERVAAATGGKKAGVREIIEATLVQMGDALKKGESLNLPAFGKVRVARPAADGGAMTLKLRQIVPGGPKGKAAKEGLAEADDQD